MNERLAVTRRVMKALRFESVRSRMDDVNDDGIPQLVICVPSDTIRYACDQVKAAGGHATIITPFRDGLIPTGWTVTETRDSDDAPPCDGPMHPDSTMGMLMEWWAASGTSDYTFRVATADGSIEVTEGPQLTIPA